jgi:hypothetical protein
MRGCHDVHENKATYASYATMLMIRKELSSNPRLKMETSARAQVRSRFVPPAASTLCWRLGIRNPASNRCEPGDYMDVIRQYRDPALALLDAPPCAVDKAARSRITPSPPKNKG